MGASCQFNLTKNLTSLLTPRVSLHRNRNFWTYITGCFTYLLQSCFDSPNWVSYKSTKDGKKSVLRSPMISKPGHCIAVDQIVSAQPGLVPQDKGQMTRARIWGCTVFVDYATSYVHVVLMCDLSIESTLAMKQEFKDKCAEKASK